jgi:light-regulated signal transduction histidine kinase (bacteriophytochrome)
VENEMSNKSDRPGFAELSDGSLIFAFAHDLRAHLRTVITHIRMVQSSGGILADRDKGFLSEAATAATDIDGLLTAMVTYCSVSYRDNSMELSLLLRGLTIELREALAEAEASLEIVSQPEALVPADIKTVFKELVLNGCRFRRTGVPPRIQIAISLSAGTLTAVVSDNGIGVEETYNEKIFEPFRGLHPHGDYPGHRLGLALCRRIVSIYGGVIGASRSTAGGLAITFTIPLMAATGNQATAEAAGTTLCGKA